MRTYSSALTQYRDETIDVQAAARPTRTRPTSRCAPKSSARAAAGADRLRHDASTPQGWKAYDVIVGGVSLVTNYRDEFNEQIKAGGVDGLIKTLADKNRGGPVSERR